MKKYLEYLRISLITSFAYKADFTFYMAINMVFFYISIALWGAVYHSTSNGVIDNYTLSNTITYFLITAILWRLDLTNSLFLGEDIWGGYFSNDLIKPWNVVFTHFVYTLSDLMIGLLTFTPFFIIMAITAHKMVSWPSGINLIYFLITTILGLAMNFMFNLILHSITFHFGDQEAQIGLVNYITSFLAGGVFPIIFIPGILRTIFLALPFKFLFFVPAEIYLGKMSASQIYLGWLQLAIWIVIFYAIYRFVYSSGLKKYSGTGR